VADHDILKEMVEKMSQGRGQDPEKRTGQERAAEVHARNKERRAEREASQGAENLPEEPSAEQLPAKPPPEESLPEEGEPVEPQALEESDDAVPEEQFLPHEEAEADDTVDNREDVQVERQDGEEETPSPERGQRN
jgi:hypothetical protein